MLSSRVIESCPSLMAEQSMEIAASVKKLLDHEVEMASVEEVRRAFSRHKKAIVKQLQSLKRLGLEGPKPSFWTNLVASLRPILDTQDEFKRTIFSGTHQR